VAFDTTFDVVFGVFDRALSFSSCSERLLVSDSVAIYWDCLRIRVVRKF
jgi:hypothetical protein